MKAEMKLISSTKSTLIRAHRSCKAASCGPLGKGASQALPWLLFTTVDVPGRHARRRRNHRSLAALSQHARGRTHHDGLAAPAGSVEQDAKALQARAVFRARLVRDGADDVLHGLSLPPGFRGGIRGLQEIEGFLAAFHGRKEAGGGSCGHCVRRQEVDVGAGPP